VTYSFRVHCILGATARIHDDQSEILLSDEGGHHATLRAKPDPEQKVSDSPEPASAIPTVAFRDTRHFVLGGRGYGSEAEAAQDGERWMSALAIGLAHHGMAADLRVREEERPGGVTEAGAVLLRDMFGLSPSTPVLTDEGGVQVFLSDPEPRFALTQFAVTKGPPTDALVASVLAASRSGVKLTSKQLIAFEMYNASFNQPGLPDVRFVCLMMAIECLIEHQQRPAEMVAIVEDAIRQAEALDGQDDDQMKSFQGSLDYLREDSIGFAGRRLIRSSIDPRLRYMGGAESPVTFFNRCYKMRSDLVHGLESRPSTADVDRRAADLEVMVGDLLSIPVGVEPRRELHDG
jgi:hypothetical protein